MRYPASEKAEIIALVEQSHLPAKRTLGKLGIPRATFYRWYDRYRAGGPEALLSVRKYHPRERHLVLPLHRIPDHDKGVRAHLPVRYDVIRFIEISFVDGFGGDEIVDFDCVRALYLHGVKFVFIDLDVSSLRELIAPPLLRLV